MVVGVKTVTVDALTSTQSQKPIVVAESFIIWSLLLYMVGKPM